MADIVLSVQDVGPSGITPSYTTVTATDNYYFPNDGSVMVHMKNTTATDCTVTIETPVTYEGLSVADKTISVVNTTGDVMAGKFPPAAYNNSDGRVKMTFSTAIDVAVIKV